MKHFGHSGDLGDIIFALPIIQQLGGRHALSLYDRPWTKRIEERYNIIAPLLLAQRYIAEVRNGDNEKPDYDFSQFRNRYVPTRTLLASQAQWMHEQYGLAKPDGSTPWLMASPSPATKGRVAIARSARYQNRYFPWKRIVEHYDHKLLFVGIKEEYDAFCSEFGKVERLPTENMLQVAEAIAGSDLFIGNQSSPNAVAEGLKHPRIQETCLWVPDCIYPGSGNAQYCADGELVLPAVGDAPELRIKGAFSGFRPLNASESPPGAWQYPGALTQYSFMAIASAVATDKGISLPDAEKLVYEFNCERVPHFFRRTEGDHQLNKVACARANAGL